jgi:glycosyltransferase involved in cell wall biosynthesis
MIANGNEMGIDVTRLNRTNDSGHRLSQKELLPSRTEKLLTASLQYDPHGQRVLTTIVIPVFNEEAALPLVLGALFQMVDKSYEVIVVDDGSSDQSVAVASQFPCRVVKHTYNQGKGAALRTGLREASGRNVMFIDADNTYPVELIPPMVRLLEQYDLVRGIRESGRENIPLVNRLGNQLFDRIIHLLHPVEGGDLLSGMYGGRRDSLLKLDLESDGFDIEAEITVKAGARGMTCATLPITYVERVGEKKLKPFRDGLRILYRVLQLAVTYNPLLVFILPGLALLGLGMLGVGIMFLEPFQLTHQALTINGAFILGISGVLGAQFVIFGLAVYAAGIAHGLRGRTNRILDRISESLRNPSFIFLGFTMGCIGCLGLVWLAYTPGSFENPAAVMLLSLSLLFGFQLLSSIAFLSALKGLQHTARGLLEK